MIKNWKKELSTNTIPSSILEKYFCIKTTCMIIFKGWINQKSTNGARYIGHVPYSPYSRRYYRLPGIYFVFLNFL